MKKLTSLKEEKKDDIRLDLSFLRLQLRNFVYELICMIVHCQFSSSAAAPKQVAHTTRNTSNTECSVATRFNADYRRSFQVSKRVSR